MLQPPPPPSTNAVINSASGWGEPRAQTCQPVVVHEAGSLPESSWHKCWAWRLTMVCRVQRACCLWTVAVGEVMCPWRPWWTQKPFPGPFVLVPALSVGGGRSRGRGSGVSLWYILCLSFVHPCGIWVCSLPVVGLRVNTQCELDVSVIDTLIIPSAVLI